MTKRPAYEWLLEWGVIDHRHEQSILRWQRIRNTDKPPLCHFRRVLHRHIPFGHLFDITLKSDKVEPGSYRLESLAELCRDPDYVARLRKKCEAITAVLCRYETPAPADEARPLFRWLLHWAYLWPRDECAIERYIVAQANPSEPHGIWLELHLSAEEKAHLSSLLVSTTETAALAFTQHEEWSRARSAAEAADEHLSNFEKGWPCQPPYTNDGERPFLQWPQREQLERLAAIQEDNDRWNRGDGTAETSPEPKLQSVI